MRISTLLVFMFPLIISYSAYASDLSTTIIESVKQDCESTFQGSLNIKEGALSEVDVTGDKIPDEIVDWRHLQCSTALTTYCGSAGCPVTIIVDNEVKFRRHVQDWTIVEWHSPILLFAVHGIECGDSNLGRCIRAVVWNDGEFKTIREK